MLFAALLLPLLLVAPPATPARAAASYRVEADDRGQPTIVVAGAGSSVTLADVRAGLRERAGLLEQPAPGVWLLRANLLVGRGVTLTIGPEAGARELRLRSQPGRDGHSPEGYDYSRFVYLRAENGAVRISGAAVRSWDPAAGAPDANPADGRAYILAKYASRLDIAGSDMGYLGSADGESYGVAWRDVNDPASPATLRRRVTGEVLDSRFHHNYYGVYTFQASGMVFRGNRFDHNVGYGFDPHDYSADFLVEANEAFANGNHGFIISRGCNGFVFRRNRSYGNRNPDPDKLAHGFMLDPGSPASADPQVPSTDNLLEGNHAYDNEGYGLRILGSPGNVVRGNRFERNRQGITVERGSAGTMIAANTLAANELHGIFVRGGAEGATLKDNTITGNGGHGIYVKSSRSTIAGNRLSDNGGDGIALLPESGAAAALADLALPEETGPAALTRVDAELLGEVTAVDAIEGAVIVGNRVERSGGHGAELKGVRGAELRGNTISGSGGHGIYLADGTRDALVTDNTIAASAGSGIRANGATTAGNRWSGNRLERNAAAPVAVTAGANNGAVPPTIALAGQASVAGTAAPGATVELLAATEPGRYEPLARLRAGPDGRFAGALPRGAAGVLAIATDSGGNSSASAALPLGYRVFLPGIVRR